MALSGSVTGAVYDYYGNAIPAACKVDWTATQNIVGNYSTVTAIMYLKSTQATITNIVLNATVCGVTISAPRTVAANDTWVEIGRATFTVNHDSNGNGNFTLTGSFVRNIPSTGYFYINSGSITSTGFSLNQIDRTAPIIELSVSNITSSGMRLSATANVSCNTWQYSTNGGGAWTTFSTTASPAASITLSGLTPDTTYSVKVRATKVSNGVTGASPTIPAKTLGATVINSAATITADNPVVEIVMSWTVYNASYTHELTIKHGSSPILTITGITAPVGTADKTITLTSEQRSTLLAAMSTVKSFTATLSLISKSGATQIGSASEKTCAIQTTAANSAPTFGSFTYKDNNSATAAVTGNDQYLVKLLSELLVTCSPATAKNGASITGYSATIGNNTKASSTTSIAVGAVSDAGDLSLNVNAIDSRGYTASLSTNVPVFDYAAPVVSDSSIRRANDVDDTVELTFEGLISSIAVAGAEKNSLEGAAYRYKKTSEAEYSAYTSILSGVTVDELSFDYVNLELAALDADYSWYLQLFIQDRLGGTLLDLLVLPGKPLIALRKGKVGINTQTPAAALDVHGDIFKDGANIFDLIYPVGSIYLSVSPINPDTLFGGTWAAFGTGRTLVGIDTSQAEFDTVEKTGGAKTHTLITAEMPAHSHNFVGFNGVPWDANSLCLAGSIYPDYPAVVKGGDYTSRGYIAISNRGSSHAHNNLQPYITVYMWKRIA